ncbi:MULTISPECIES: DUF2892 domain-containing protein [unclassified Bradyrhizobium]|uniref:YgaP family membrane protein n=1 Tax=unclassified Bradyrhizobium TaxID=2631580 RepID=UPI00247912D7|nr:MULTISPECIES: DUF2892 domain-containing protein [unclassified Bradyrhizobium]WGR73795.1 DUF2892 domain-containing protein [Bradyrhizobium sp. ISRA426]WGR78633.1 DUF2892 domain-containing protein [Bradyrhizobium sp. ISRA430]WGR89034.1 DUF2892 domain-containing protein [Bradyrhizobium sp. ISRA432]
MMYLKRNLPGWERAIRGGMGVGLAVLSYTYGATPWTWIGIAAGAMMIGTGFIGFCPMCAMVGRKSIEKQ